MVYEVCSSTYYIVLFIFEAQHQIILLLFHERCDSVGSLDPPIKMKNNNIRPACSKKRNLFITLLLKYYEC